MNRQTLIAGVVALAVGLLVGRYALPSSAPEDVAVAPVDAHAGHAGHDPADQGAPMGHGEMGAMGGGEAVDPAQIAALEERVKAEPRNADLLVELGRMERRTGEEAKAREHLAQAIKIDPNHANGHYELGVLDLHNASASGEAIAQFESYLKIAPDGQHAEMARRSIEHLRSLPPQ